MRQNRISYSQEVPDRIETGFSAGAHSGSAGRKLKKGTDGAAGASPVFGEGTVHRGAAGTD